MGLFWIFTIQDDCKNQQLPTSREHKSQGAKGGKPATVGGKGE